MKYTKELIQERYNAGEKLKVLAFWGHKSYPGTVTKTCFSQWYDCIFEVEGEVYHTAEQFMMAQKAKLMGDMAIYKRIMEAKDPRDHKALGRKVKSFDPVLWNQKKYDIVLRGNLAKFSQTPELFAFLDGTGDCVLVEGSPYDEIWGVKLRHDDPRINDPGNWQGENLLGFALMETRDILRESRQRGEL